MSLFILIAYSGLVALSSLVGGIIVTRIHMTHLRMQTMMSFVGGLILGVAVLHMIPHALMHSNNVDAISISVLAGVVVMLFLMRVFHVHQHQSDEDVPCTETAESGLHQIQLGEAKGAGKGSPAGAVQDCGRDGSGHSHAHQQSHSSGHSHAHTGGHTHGHKHDAGHGHHHDHSSTHHHPVLCSHEGDSAPPNATWRWLGFTVGMVLHSLLDGAALAAFVIAENHPGHTLGWALPGFGIFLAVCFHKPLDAASVMWLMRSSHLSPWKLRLSNIGYSLLSPLGAVIMYFGFADLSHESLILACLLGFSGGMFLCISLSDLIPEVQFHSHDRVRLSGALLLGVLLAWVIGFFEPKHEFHGDHNHAPSVAPVESKEHDHDHSEADGHKH